MIALLSFFALFQPRVQFFLREKRSSVDPLHLRPFRVPFPVSARQRQQLERFESICVRHVRAETKIDER